MLTSADLLAAGNAARALLVNPLRTALATLGVVIGVAAVVTVLALVDGLEAYAREELARSTGVQMVTVAPKVRRIVNGFSLPNGHYLEIPQREAEAMAREIPSVANYSLSVGGTGVFVGPSGRRWAAPISATLPATADFERLDVELGRFFTEPEADRNAPVVVLSYYLASHLAAPNPPESLLDRRVRVSHGRRRVIGILARSELSDRGFAYVPLRGAARALSGTPGPAVLQLQASRVEEVQPLEQRTEDWLATRHGPWDERVEVTTSEVRLASVKTNMLVFRLIMGAVAGVSLLVGGIGIMNVLLASIVERTREIGIRRAVGARRHDLVVQFLAESVAIAGAGSAAGVLLGLAGAYGIAAILRTTLEEPLYVGLTWTTPLVAVASAAAVGLTFGTYPALRAARISPIDAIRHD